MRHFVLLSMPRTGSSMVAAMLGTHPDIVCLPAVFSDKQWKTFSEEDEDPWEMNRRLHLLKPRWGQVEDRLADIPAFLADADEVNRDRAVWGFKQHLGPRGNDRTSSVIGLAWPTILLSRSNLLASYSSNEIVKLTGQGAAKAGATLHAAKTVFDAGDFTTYMRRRRAIYAYWEPIIDAGGVPTLRIEYAEARTDAGMDRIATFLGQPAGLFGSWPTAKRNSDDILSRFDNPDDAKTFLADNGLSHWASEDA